MNEQGWREFQDSVISFEEYRARYPEPTMPPCRWCGKPVHHLQDTHCGFTCMIEQIAAGVTHD